MSRTFIHIGKGLFNNKINTKNNKAVNLYLRFCDRHNFERGEFKHLRNELKSKISNRELNNYKNSKQ